MKTDRLLTCIVLQLKDGDLPWKEYIDIQYTVCIVIAHLKIAKIAINF